jgi:hypothetical protein
MPPERGSTPKVDQLVALEREVLEALCASEHVSDDRGRLLGTLASHVWQDPEHRVVYEALLRIRTRDPRALRAELPATATRMGFPDVEWDEYFERGDALQVRDVENRIRALAAPPHTFSGSRDKAP